MAAKVRFNDMISSVSGVIKRERMEDGSIRSIIIRKNGTMYTATHQRRTKLKETEQQSRKRFSILCGAYTILRREMKQTFNTITRTQNYLRQTDQNRKKCHSRNDCQHLCLRRMVRGR